MAEDVSDYMRMLEAHDDAEDWYYPPDFDYEAAERRFLDFAQEFQMAFGVYCIVESGSSIQDASFLGQIYLPKDHFNRPEQATDPISVRVSNWGDMATVSDDSALKSELLERIKALLQQFGYVYIPPSVLVQPHPRYPKTSWWIRYFDWI
jgi:hypothetical protein